MQYRPNPPIGGKALDKKLERLVEMGLPLEEADKLRKTLGRSIIDASQAIYILDWWSARLTLTTFLETLDPKIQEKCISSLQNYMSNYKLTAYDMALDGELQIDYYPKFQHYLDLATVNPYFREMKWNMLHRVKFLGNFLEGETTFEWLGKLEKENTILTNRKAGFDKGSPAIKLVRGAYLGDPVGEEEEMEIPKPNIISMTATLKPSDLLAYLKDAEDNLQMARFFVPQVHEPFLTFPDGKSWAIVDRLDKKAEASSLRDCATAQYSSANAVVISLREPVPPEYYKTILRAEIVFPSGVHPDYEEFKNSVGVVNQLRGYANSKPKSEYHKYIVPLLEQTWVAQIVKPTYQEDNTFYLSDLSEVDQQHLREKNPILFDPNTFYAKLKDQKYPYGIKDQIIENLNFPISYVEEVLVKATKESFALADVDVYGRRRESDEILVALASLKKKLKRRDEEGNPVPPIMTDELRHLLQTAEETMIRIGRSEIADRLYEVGVELSNNKIQQIFQEFLSPKPPQEVSQIKEHPLLEVASKSLSNKIQRREADLEPLLTLAREILIEDASKRNRSTYPPEHIRVLQDCVGLTISQILPIMEDQLHNPQMFFRKPLWNIAIYSLATGLAFGWKVSDADQLEGLTPLMPLIRELLLQGKDGVVTDLLSINLVELPSEDILQVIIEATKDKKVPNGRIWAALVSLNRKTVRGQPISPKIIAATQKFLLSNRAMDLSSKALESVDLPIKNIIQVLASEKVTPTVRKIAFASLRKKVQNGDSKVRGRVFRVVLNLLLKTRSKPMVDEIINIFEGHQRQYELCYKFIRARLDWLTEDKNIKYFIKLIRSVLPSSESNERYGDKTLPKEIEKVLSYLLQSKPDNCALIIKLLFEIRFGTDIDSDKKRISSLLEKTLDVIIHNPEKLTRDLCLWYQREPGGWGTYDHRRFPSIIPLSSKLKRQFRDLLVLSKKTGNDCYLDLAISIAERMSADDKEKLSGLASTLVKETLGRGKHWMGEYLKRLLGL